tara:strand:+ start:47 stop:526 length:480 start_codon:yes stop_codon:yes gene_type:complete
MMASGKSTVGKSLSKLLGMQFVDTDDIIKKRLSLSITKIFKTKGESFFREIEEEESIKLVKKEGLIIALGGGAFMNSIIRENIKKSSLSVWLDLSIDKIFERTKMNKKRPLLHNISKEDLKKLYEERKKTYSLADFRIDCNSKEKNKIVEEIKKLYESI